MTPSGIRPFRRSGGWTRGGGAVHVKTGRWVDCGTLMSAWRKARGQPPDNTSALRSTSIHHTVLGAVGETANAASMRSGAIVGDLTANGYAAGALHVGERGIVDAG
jgi:hypothetical protein